MFKFLKKLLSRKNNEIRKYKESVEEILRSVDAFKNRKIHYELTKEIIDDTPDDKLLQTVFDNIWTKIDYSKDYETVTALNKSRQAFYYAWILEGEVNNGGFNQFYFNSSGKFYKLIPDSLDLLKAHKMADLTRKANYIYEIENAKITKHQDGTLDGFSKSYEENPLNELDGEFYKMENLRELQITYVRNNWKEFIDK